MNTVLDIDSLVDSCEGFCFLGLTFGFLCAILFL
jgi:hypothetical protein